MLRGNPHRYSDPLGLYSVEGGGDSLAGKRTNIQDGERSSGGNVLKGWNEWPGDGLVVLVDEGQGLFTYALGEGPCTLRVQLDNRYKAGTLKDSYLRFDLVGDLAHPGNTWNIGEDFPTTNGSCGVPQMPCFANLLVRLNIEPTAAASPYVRSGFYDYWHGPDRDNPSPIVWTTTTSGSGSSSGNNQPVGVRRRDDKISNSVTDWGIVGAVPCGTTSASRICATGGPGRICAQVNFSCSACPVVTY